MRRLALGTLPLLVAGCMAALPAANPSPPSPSPTVSPTPPPTPAVSPTPTAIPTPTPWPSPAASQLTYVCAYPSTNVLTLPAGPLDAQGLPLPGALAVGARLDALPLLHPPYSTRQHAQRSLLGEGVGFPPRNREDVYTLADGTTLRAMIATLEASSPDDFNQHAAGDYLAAAIVTAPTGLSDLQAMAWLRALEPCGPLPDLQSPYNHDGCYRDDIDVNHYAGLTFDAVTLLACHSVDDPWLAFTNAVEAGTPYDDGNPSPQPTPSLPPGRWVGVLAEPFSYGK